MGAKWRSDQGIGGLDVMGYGKSELYGYQFGYGLNQLFKCNTLKLSDEFNDTIIRMPS